MEKVRSLVLVKIETTYGTDASPSETTDAIITLGEPTFDIVANAKERNVPLSYFGKIAPVIVGEALKLSFKVELKGSGTAGTPPKCGRLLRIANFTETINAGSSVSYALNSNLEGESATIYFWSGGTRHKLKGCVANIKIPLQAGELMTMDVEVTGLYDGTHYGDVTFPTPTFDNILPQPWDSAAFKLGSLTNLVISKLDIDLGNEIAKRTDANADNGISRYYIKDRTVKFSFDPEKEALTTFDPLTYHKNQTSFNIETKPAGSAGNTIEIVANGLVLDAPPKYGNRENVIVWDLSAVARPTLSSGNSELQITFK